jgi:hypothetical protein
MNELGWMKVECRHNKPYRNQIFQYLLFLGFHGNYCSDCGLLGCDTMRHQHSKEHAVSIFRIEVCGVRN